MTTKRNRERTSKITFSLWIIAALLALILLALLLPQSQFAKLFQREDATWQAMQSRGTWRVGLDPSFPPFESLDAEGRPVGYDIDLAQEIAQRWGLELEIVTIGYDSLIDALQASKIDSIVSAFPHDPRLTQDFTFSPSYFEAGLRLAVVDPTRWSLPDEWNDETLAALLADQAVAVEWGSMGDMIARRLHRLEPTIEVVALETPQDAIGALGQSDKNRVDALLVDNVTFRQAQAEYAIQSMGPAIESNPYVIVIPKQSKVLETQVAQILLGFEESGVLDAIETRWFGSKVR